MHEKTNNPRDNYDHYLTLRKLKVETVGLTKNQPMKRHLKHQ